MGKEKETALPKNIRQIGEIRGAEKICIEDYVMTCIHKKEPQEKDGYLGIFYGEQREEEDGIYLFLRGILEIPDGEEEAVKKELEEQKEKYFPDWDVQGCCVRPVSDRTHEAGGEAEPHVYAADLSSAGTGGKSLLDGGGLL